MDRSSAEGVRLGDFMSLVRGTTYKSARLDEPGPLLLGLASIARDGGFRNESLRTYGGESGNRLLLHPGDLYVSLKDVTQSGDLLGAVARVPHHVALGRLTQDTVRLDFDGSANWRRYVYWALRAPEYRQYCRARAMGTTNLSLSREDFLDFRLPCLSPEREILVNLLEALDEKIELNRRMSRTLDEMGQRVYEEWFAGALLLAGHISGAGQRTGWRSSSVGAEFCVTMGQSPPGETYNVARLGLPFYQGRVDFGFRTPTRRVYCTMPTRFANAGDTLVSVRAPVGSVNMAADRCAVGRGVAAVRHDLGCSSYTFHSMRHLKNRFAEYESSGTVFGSISKAGFAAIPMAAPPAQAIEEYERVARPLDDRVLACEGESLALADTRDILLPRLLS